jgi:putative transcriptional regulator
MSLLGSVALLPPPNLALSPAGVHHGEVSDGATEWERWTAESPVPPAAGHLLVATSVLGDRHFSRTVIYLLEHHGEGSLGVVLNRPSTTSVGEVLPRWRDVVSGPAVLFEGGPVQPDGALCLGAVQDPEAGARPLHGGVASIDLDGDPDAVIGRATALRVFAGYAGWAAGQLEDELEEGAWWVVSGSLEDLFSDHPEGLWSRVLRRQRPPLSYMSTLPPDPTRN